MSRALTPVRCADISLSRRRERGGTRQEGRKVRLHRARTHAGAAAAVRDAEGLVQVEVRDVRAPLAGPGDADQGVHVGAVGVHLPAVRSEEHTSELQSLMRISYAVFCLKKKNNII